MPITPYGNAESGDYPALFIGCFEASYPKSRRLIFGFAILNEDRETAHDGPDGEGLYAVAVCNKSEGTNPKSKPFKIRRAMLQPEEYRDLNLVANLPPPEHFTQPHCERQRVLDIRVERRQKDGKQVSVVTHICRPRDGEWQCIEGVYEGAAPGIRNGRPFWLNEDGTAIRYDDGHANRLVQAGTWQSGQEPTEWLLWHHTTPEQLERWRNPDGTLRVLAADDVAALEGFDPARYRVAQRRAANRWPPFG
jgi:hypothetical protein